MLGLGGGSALAAGALRVASASAATTGQTRVLAALRVIQTLRTVYGKALRSGTLNERDTELAREFVTQSRTHAKLLAGLLGPNADPAGPPQPADVPGLDQVESAHRYLELALGFEGQAYLACSTRSPPSPSASPSSCSRRPRRAPPSTWRSCAARSDRCRRRAPSRAATAERSAPGAGPEAVAGPPPRYLGLCR